MFWKRIKKVFILLLLLLLVINNLALAEEEKVRKRVTDQDLDKYWKKLKKRADELYGGLDLKVEVLTGLYKSNEYQGEVKMKVPLYSKEKRREKAKKKRTFLDKGAKLLKELEFNLDNQRLLEEKENFLETIMLENGIQSIDAYYDVKTEKKKVEARIGEIVRKLEVLIEN